MEREAVKASREELVKFWALQRLLDFYCFETCGCKGCCLVWCDNGTSFKADLVDLCPHEAVRKVMALLHKMLRRRPVSYYTPRGEEYEEVMAEVEERLKGDVAVILDTS
jgi:hypothetical protein